MKEWSGGFPNGFPHGMTEGSTPASEAGQTGHICYVDDSKTSAYVTRKILKDQNYQVDHFTSAEPAVVALLQKQYDLLITDLTLETGGMDGDDLLSFLRRSGEPRNKSLPVILITGHTDKDTLLRLYESGANAVLSKPIAGDTLLEKVRGLIPEKPRDWQPGSGNGTSESQGAGPRRHSLPAGQARNNAAQRILMQQAAFRKTSSGANGEQRPRSVPKVAPPPVRPMRANIEPRNRPVAPVSPNVAVNPVRSAVKPVIQERQTRSDAMEAPENPFIDVAPPAENGGRSLGQTLGSAVKNAMEAARQKLADKSAAADSSAAPRANEAAELIARLRQQKKPAAKAAEIPTLNETTAPVAGAEPAQQPAPEPFFFEEKSEPVADPFAAKVAAEEVPEHVAPVQPTIQAPAEAIPEPTPVQPRAEAPRQAAPEAAAQDGNVGIETRRGDVDVDSLFAGLAAGSAPARPAAQPAETAPVSDGRRMITALDVGTDLVNMQDNFYEDSHFSVGGLNVTPALTRLWSRIQEYKIIIAAVVLAAILIVSNFSNVLTGTGTAEVETVRVGLGSIHQSLNVPGSVVSNMKVDVSSSSSGKIVAISVKEGQLVDKGDTLAEIENEQAISNVKRAEGNLQSAREETQLADKTWKRMRHAFGLGAVSRFAVEEAEAALKTAKAREAVALEEVRSSRLALNKLSVIAPFTGTVTVRHAQVGQWVAPSEPLFTLVDMSKREIELKVDTADSSLIKTGQAVSLSSDAYPGKTWMGEVTRVATATNRNQMTNTVAVYVSMGTGAPDLRIGQQVDAEIRHSSSSNIIKLPVEALISRNGATWVAVVQDGRVHFSPVVIGMEDMTHVEVLEGVRPRQEVIIPKDANSLQEGDLVRVLATRTVE